MKTMTPYAGDFSVIAAVPLTDDQLKIVGIKFPKTEAVIQAQLKEMNITEERFSEFVLARNVGQEIMASGTQSREMPAIKGEFFLLPKTNLDNYFVGGKDTQLNTTVLGFDGINAFDVAQLNSANIYNIARKSGDRPIIIENGEPRILSWVGYDGSLATFGEGDFAIQGRAGESLFVTQEWFNSKVSVIEKPAVTVYTKNQCPQCDFTKRQLDRSGIRYDEINVEDQPELLNELLADGWKSVPVVKTRNPFSKSEVSWAGNRPDMVQELVDDLATAQRKVHEQRFLSKPGTRTNKIDVTPVPQEMSPTVGVTIQ